MDEITDLNQIKNQINEAVKEGETLSYCLRMIQNIFIPSPTMTIAEVTELRDFAEGFYLSEILEQEEIEKWSESPLFLKLEAIIEKQFEKQLYKNAIMGLFVVNQFASHLTIQEIKHLNTLLLNQHLSD